MQARLPVVISGTLEDGRAFREKTHVLTVSKFGARLKTELPLTPGMEIMLKPLEGKQSSRFRVVWAGGADSAHSGEVGIEYVKVSSLLGVAFPE